MSQADQILRLKQRIYRKLTEKRIPVRLLTVLRTAWKGFRLAQGGEAAASIAYYALFSLFPLLLFLVSISGLFLSPETGLNVLLDFIGQILPIENGELSLVIGQLQMASRFGGLIGLVGLIWAASGMFTGLVRHISHAWPDAPKLGALQGRIVAMLVIILLALLEVLWWSLTTVLSLLMHLEIRLLNRRLPIERLSTNLVLNIIAEILIFLGFIGIYRFIPKARVRWREAFWASLFASSAVFLVTRGYALYLGSGLSSLNLLYGSLGTILGLIVLIYLNSWIILFGAHLSSAIATVERVEKARLVLQAAGIPINGGQSDELEGMAGE